MDWLNAFGGVRGRTLRVLVTVMAVGMMAGCSQAGSGVARDGVAPVRAPSPRVAEFLGPDVVAILSAPDRVEPFLLEPALSADAKGPGTIAGYAWKARGAAFEVADLRAFQNLALDAASYDFEIAKKCPMVPEYAIRFMKGEAAVDVLLSFQCTMWEYVYKDARKREDFDPARDPLRKIVGTIFRMP